MIEGWDKKHLRRLKSVVWINGFPLDSDRFTYESENRLPVIRIRDLGAREFETFTDEPVADKYLVQKGDLLIGMDGAFNVTLWQRGEGILNQRVMLLRGNLEIVKYLFYALPLYLDGLNAETKSLTVKHLSSFDVQKFKIPFPPASTLSKVVELLDLQAEELDSQILAANRLLEVLGEKRFELVRKTFERLVHPSVKLGQLASFKSGGTPDSKNREFYGGTIPWATISDMTKEGKEIFSTAESVTPEGLASCSAQWYEADTILYALYASIGKSSIARVKLSSNQAILNIKPKKRLDLEFLYYYLVSQEKEVFLLARSNTQANLNAGIVKSYKVPLPPLEEQQAIVSFLNIETDRMQAQAKVVKRLVETLVEKKRTLVRQIVAGELAFVNPNLAN